MNEELFAHLLDIGVIMITDNEKLAKIRAYIAKLQQEIADAKAATALALEQVNVSAEVVAAAKKEAADSQLLADQAKEAQRVAEEAFAADQANDAALSAGLTELVDSIPVEVVPA